MIYNIGNMYIYPSIYPDRFIKVDIKTLILDSVNNCNIYTGIEI